MNCIKIPELYSNALARLRTAVIKKCNPKFKTGAFFLLLLLLVCFNWLKVLLCVCLWCWEWNLPLTHSTQVFYCLAVSWTPNFIFTSKLICLSPAVNLRYLAGYFFLGGPSPLTLAFHQPLKTHRVPLLSLLLGRQLMALFLMGSVLHH